MPATRRGTNLFGTVLQAVFFFFGLAALGYWGYSTLETQAVQAYEEWAFEQELSGREASVKDYAGSFVGREPEPAERAHPETSRRAHPAPSGSWKARIQIPRVEVEAVVHPGVDKLTLRRAVGHIPGTALPGQAGNVGLAAHRDTFFRGLRNIKEDDVIIVETHDGRYHYEVDSMRIVSPDRVDVLDATVEPTLTLVTCYPFNFIGKAPKRFIVHARQVTPAPAHIRGS